MRIASLRRWIAFAFVLGLGTAALSPGRAFADHVVIQRHVTVRVAPSRQSAVVTFPDVGAAFTLLDDGARTSGYYHIKLSDGREGWVYYTYVQRRPGDAPGATLTTGVSGTDRIAVHYINVDQGAAALLEFPCAAIMIDAGGRGADASGHLIAYLDAFFARRPDLNHRLAAVFITHTHVDHNSNLQAIAGRYVIGGYIHNGILDGSGRNAARWMVGYSPTGLVGFAQTATPPIPVREVSEADVVAAGDQGLSDGVIDPVDCPRVDPKIRVLSGRYDEDPGWPDGEFENGNNQSLVIRVDYGEASFLFTGDLEEPAIESLVARYTAGHQLDVDVYEVGHHGSHNGTTASLLAAMSPEAAVISMGPMAIQKLWTAWAYGHPRRVTVERLDHGVSGRRAAHTVMVADKVKAFTPYALTHAVYATGWDGDVTISSGPNGVLQIDPGQ